MKIIPVILFIFVFVIVLPYPCQAEDFFLFTPEEQQKLRYEKLEWQQELDYYLQEKTHSKHLADKGFAPVIMVVVPEKKGNRYLASIPLHLLVQLKGLAAPINTESLSVKGKKGWFSRDITDRIKPFLREPTEEEEADIVIDAKIPKIDPGHYQIIVQVEDMMNNTREMVAFLEVRM